MSEHEITPEMMDDASTRALFGDTEPGKSELAASSCSLDRLVMPLERWKALMANDDLGLTTEEIAAGWHFCWEWDGLIIGPGMKELECCKCKAA
jgi:hypothetical protein